MNHLLYRQCKRVAVVFNVWTALCGDPIRQTDTSLVLLPRRKVSDLRSWCSICVAARRPLKAVGGGADYGLFFFSSSPPPSFRERRLSFTALASELHPPLRSHDQWAGIPLFTLLKIDSTHCYDVASRDKTHLSSPPLPCLTQALPLLLLLLPPPILLSHPDEPCRYLVCSAERRPRAGGLS